MSNMLEMDGDDDMVLEPVTIVVVAGIGALVTTQQSNKTMQKKTQFTWSHHGMNPNLLRHTLFMKKNYKDEILIHHLMQVSPWKARHGNVKSAWEK